MQPFFWVFRLKRYPFNNLLRGAAGFRIFLVPPPEFLFIPQFSLNTLCLDLTLFTRDWA